MSIRDLYNSIRSQTSDYESDSFGVIVKGNVRTDGGEITASAIYGGSSAGGGQGGASALSTPLYQYAANRDSVFTSIRPGAIVAASQPWRVGFTQSQEASQENEIVRKNFRKRAIKSIKYADQAPPIVRKSMQEGRVIVLDDHPVLSLFENPNDFFDGWSTVYCTYFSLQLTGRSYWLINQNDEKPSGVELFYLPSHWVEPVHEDNNMFARWKIQSSGGESFEVGFENIIWMNMPNPGNPMSSYSSLQSQARAVNIEDKILTAQYEAMENGIYPSVILRAGRLPDMPFRQGELPVLTPDQRKRLVTTIKLATAGVMNYREPFIVDGLIEGIEKFSSSVEEMDFQGSSALTQDRIMSGFGTNPYSTGRVDNVNRATASVASEHTYELQVNPIIDLISRAVDRRISPLFHGTQTRMKLWLERAVPNEPEALMSRISIAPGILKRGDLRKYMVTGRLEIGEMDDDDELVESGGSMDQAFGPEGGSFGGRASGQGEAFGGGFGEGEEEDKDFDQVFEGGFGEDEDQEEDEEENQEDFRGNE